METQNVRTGERRPLPLERMPLPLEKAKSRIEDLARKLFPRKKQMR